MRDSDKGVELWQFLALAGVSLSIFPPAGLLTWFYWGQRSRIRARQSLFFCGLGMAILIISIALTFLSGSDVHEGGYLQPFSPEMILIRTTLDIVIRVVGFVILTALWLFYWKYPQHEVTAKVTKLEPKPATLGRICEQCNKRQAFLLCFRCGMPICEECSLKMVRKTREGLTEIQVCRKCRDGVLGL